MKTAKKDFANNSNQSYLKLLHKFYNQRKNAESFKTYRNTIKNVNQRENINEVPHSIKPLFCSVPKDVCLHKIFVNMMKSSFKINGNKSIYFQMSADDLEERNYVLKYVLLSFFMIY